jgi:hypothetical protein
VLLGGEGGFVAGTGGRVVPGGVRVARRLSTTATVVLVAMTVNGPHGTSIGTSSLRGSGSPEVSPAAGAADAPSRTGPAALTVSPRAG